MIDAFVRKSVSINLNGSESVFVDSQSKNLSFSRQSVSGDVGSDAECFGRSSAGDVCRRGLTVDRSTDVCLRRRRFGKTEILHVFFKRSLTGAGNHGKDDDDEMKRNLKVDT